MKKTYLSPKFEIVGVVASTMIAASAPEMRNYNKEENNTAGNNSWNGIWSR